MSNNIFSNIDCMIGMAEYEDKHFDLAIVDPPYMDNIDEYMGMQKRLKGLATGKVYNNVSYFGKPNDDYFDELFRVSRNQIVWGVNHYNRYFGCGRIIWDKNISGIFNDAELAYQSTSNAIRIFRYTWNGMLQENMKNKEIRIHPTQKPVALYKWLLTKYAKQGDLILDTHVGSASSLIACEDLGFEYVGFELDKDYFDVANKRLEQFRAQLKLKL